MNTNFHKSNVDNLPIGYAYHRIIFDENGIPKDYEFIDVNSIFETIIGLHSKWLINRKISEISSIAGNTGLDWLTLYNNIVNDNKREHEEYFPSIDKFYRINLYCPNKDFLISYFTDITRELKEKDRVTTLVSSMNDIVFELDKNLNFTNVNISDENHKKDFIYAAAHDIAVFETIISGLQHSKEELQLLSDNIPTQIWYLQSPEKYGAVNKAHADFLGVKKEDIEFKYIRDFLSESESAICTQGNKRVFLEKKQIITEEWLADSYNIKRLLRISKNPRFNSKGEVELVICSAEDITEQKCTELELLESENRLNLFFQQSLSGCFFMMLDKPLEWNEGIDKEKTIDYIFKNQRITRVNQTMLGQYMMSENDFIGKTPNELYAHDRETGKKIWYELFDKGRLHVSTNERRSDGTQMWIEGDYVCLYDSEGRIIGHFGVQQDVTEKRTLEEQKIVRERILYSMIEFTHELLTNADSNNALSKGITLLGKATGVDRVYYWENHYDHKLNRWLTSQRLEWCSKGITPQIGNTNLQNIPFEEVGDFMEDLLKNKPFITHVNDLKDGYTKKTLKAQGIYSLFVLPIYIEGVFKGFIGFDSCKSEKIWSEVEISLLYSFVLLYIKSVERNLLEQQIIKVKENFNNFFDTVSDILIVLDMDGRIIYANKSAIVRLKYTEEDLLGEHVSMLHPKELHEKAISIIGDMFSGKTEYCNLPAITKDGEIIHMETRINKGLWNDMPVLFSVSKDISALRMSEEKFSKAFNHSGVSSCISTFSEGIYLEVNDTFLTTFGFQRNEVIGKKSQDLNIFVEKNQREELIKQIDTYGKISDVEISVRNKNNQVKTALMNITPLYINNVLCLLTSMLDITDRKLMMEELEKAKEASEIANKAKSRFLSDMSHEIKTPMNAVISYADLLLYTDLNAKQVEYLSGIKVSSNMLMNILNDILDWEKIDSNSLELQHSAFNLADIIRNALNQVKVKSIYSGVEIQVDIDENIPSTLYGDPLRLHQVLLNLLSNAVKFTPQGKIRIEVIQINEGIDNILLQFSVKDTGVGISEDKISTIFDPFKQDNYKLSSKYGGTGLGLAICKKLVNLMGGEIWLRSKIGIGSTFYFTANFNTKVKDLINGAKINVGSYQKPILNINGRLAGVRVLVVDDNEINQDVLKEVLKNVGMIVDIASSGNEAVNLVKIKNYDIILMDLRMPEMDGYQATTEIRKFKSSNELPIIAVTASASIDERERCIALDINDYVIKPINKKVLFEKIVKYINKSVIDSVTATKIEDETYMGFENSGINIEEALNYLNNNNKLLFNILRMFNNNHRNTVDEIRQALLNNDYETAKRIAHTVKGVAGQIAAKKLYKLLATVEKLINEDVSNIESNLLQLENEIHKVTTFIDSMFDEDKK